MSLLNLDRFIPKSSIKVSYYDNDGTLVKDATQDQALEIEKLRPGTKFFHTNNNGSVSELGIDGVINLVPKNLLPQGPPCPTAPQNCGPPKVKIFGGNGIGAIANAIISPNSNSVIGFDIVDPGRGFFDPPYVELVDDCGKGRGGLGIAVIGPLDGTNGNPSVVNPITGEPEIGVIDIIVDSPGNGYIARPDGSLGGDERVWAEADEGYIIDDDGNYFVVPEGVTVPETGTYFPPRVTSDDDVEVTTPSIYDDDTGTGTETGTGTGVQPTQKFPTTSNQYPVILEIGSVVVADPGFGYEPGDTISITPDNGAVLEPTIEGGSVTGVKVLKPGIGFNDIPTIEVVSDNGYNAEFKPVFRVVDPETVDDLPVGAQIVQVIDCVGKV